MGVKDHKRRGCIVQGDDTYWSCKTHNAQTSQGGNMKHKTKRISDTVTELHMIMEL